MSHKWMKDTTKGELFSLQDVAVSQGQRVILQPITLQVPCVAGVAVVGVSGSGKTTLLRTLLGLLENTGYIKFLGEDISFVLENISLYRRIGVLFQQAGLLDDLTVEENCRVSQELSVRGVYAPEIIERYLSTLQLWDARKLLPWQLSGGMLHRAGLARALVRHAECLILDEPTTGQDADNAKVIQDVLLDYQKNGGHVIIISHDYLWLKPLVQWSLLVHEGHIAYQGPLLKTIKTSQEIVV